MEEEKQQQKLHFARKITIWTRLACQVKVKQDMDITIPESVFELRNGKHVVSNYNVASFIKEFVVKIPEDMNYKAGGYIQIEIPESEVNYKDMDITAHPEEHDSADKFKAEWDKFNLWPLVMKNPETVERAYSMASFPAEGREIMLNVRGATPPWDRNKNNWADLNPGIASSYIFENLGIRLQFLAHMVNFSLMSPMQRCFMLAVELEWHHEIPFISFIQNIKNW